MAGPLAYTRLLRWVWALARADALIPRELEDQAPPAVRAAGRALRLLAGPQARRGRPGERLARVFERLGPVSIKFGQLLSTRADIFGGVFAEDLARLKDKLAPFPADQARAEVARALGRPLESLFAEFGPPVAAASLAQAHAARLVDGRKVAVKVLRPRIERRVAADAETLALAGRLADRFVPAARRLEPMAFAAIVTRALQLELDLRMEAAGAAELGEVMRRDGYMDAPAVVWDGVGRRVLTLAWAEGVALTDAEALTQPGLDRRALADNLIRAFLAQALDQGVFHADLHEGNLFVAAPARITAVDFGIVGRLGPPERRYLAEILWGFLRRDYDRLARVHLDAGYVPRTHDMGAFAQALRAVGEPLVGRPAAEISMGRVIAQLFEITALFDMRLRPELVLLQKTMVTVEGVARRIDPNHDIWTAAEPIVRRWIERELSPAAKARDLVREASQAARTIIRLAEAPPPPVALQPPPREGGQGLWFALGAAAAGLAFALAAAFR